MRSVFIGFACWLTTIAAPAQSVVSGTVVDSVSGHALAKATVVLLRQGKTLKFGRTDEQGRFTLDIAPEPGDELQATLIGYAKRRQPVGKDNTLRLTEQAFQLREVKVEGAPVQQRRDTIVYDLTKYANDRDNSLKDVLKKLPGVDVEKNGQIKYNGKAISRFTVEGLDLSKGRYNKLTENIRAEDVKKAEVVEHDQPVKALRNRVFTDNVGMNIVLKDSARDQLAVTLRPYLLVGEPTHVGGDGVAMQIGRKRQMEYSGQYDRTGRDLANQFSVFYDFYDFAATATLPQWYTAPALQAPIDEERLRRNTSQAYSVDYLSKGRNDAENSFSISYNRNVIRQHTQNISQYYLDGQSLQETTQDESMTLRQDAFSMDYNHRINADTHFGSIVIKAHAAQDNGLSDFITTLQRVRTPELDLTAAVNQTYTLRTGLLEGRSTVDYHYARPALYLQARQSPTQKLALNNNLWHTAHYLSWNRQRGQWHRNYAFKLEAENLNVQATDNVLLQAAVLPAWSYKDDNWHITLAPGATLRRLTRQQASLLMPSALLTVARDCGNRSDWSLGINYTENSGDWTTLALSQRRSNYRTWTDAPDFVPRLRQLGGTISYNYKRALYQFFSGVKLSYGRNWNSAASDMQIHDGQYHYTWIRHGTHADDLSVSANISKGWHNLHLKTNLSASATYAQGQQYTTGKAVDYSFTSYTFRPQVIYSPSWMEIDYQGTFSFNRSKTAGERLQTLGDRTQRLTLTATVASKVDFSVSGVLYHNELTDAPAVNTLLADAALTWRLRGRVRLSINGRNLFDRRTYAESTYSGIGCFTNRYELRPREWLVTVQWAL